jgi:RND superfamily putative drug exporter
VLAAWLLALVALTPLANRLSDLENDDFTADVPVSAQSARVEAASALFPSDNDALIVVSGDGALTKLDRQAATQLHDQLAASPVPGTSAPGPVDVTPTGTLALISVPVVGDTDDVVDALRARIADGNLNAEEGDGPRIEVTGPAGLRRDADATFAGLDTTLLLATVVIVTILLLAIYRSPVLWLLPVLCVAAAVWVVDAVIYLLANYAGLTFTALDSAILTVLVFGVGTDYALLLIGRYRDELTERPDRYEAMGRALRRTLPAVAASALTVMAAMLLLSVARMGNTRSLGPVAAVGIAGTLITMATLLPALLLVLGRWIFWPRIPVPERRVGAGHRLWSRLAGQVDRRPGLLVVGCLIILAACGSALAVSDLSPTTPLDQYRAAPESVLAEQRLSSALPAGTVAPLEIVVHPASVAPQARQLTQTMPGIASVSDAQSGSEDVARFTAVIDSDPFSNQSYQLVRDLRKRLSTGLSAGRADVGGTPGQQVDIIDNTDHDAKVIIPLVLIAITLVLALLLRAVVASVVILLTTVLSFFAAFGLAAAVATKVIGLSGINRSVPLYAFIFLVSLGVDYTVFLAVRAREESRELGARQGMLSALSTTGGVISSAGLVLAATFAVLTGINFATLIEIGATVALGVLLDTFVVRTVLVPALAWLLGSAFWWPSRPQP